MIKYNLQMFADGENQNQSVRSYTKEFKDFIEAVFGARAYFRDFFVNDEIEAIDGVSNGTTAFSVKTSDIPVVVGEYSKDANTGMGTGTGKSSRFGNRTEVIYKDIDVPYSWGYTFHEGLDRHTVNNDLDSAVADRLELQANAKMSKFDKQHGKFISANAGKSIAGGVKVTKDNVVDVFNELSKYFVNIGAVGTKRAKVTADVYNAIVDTGLATTAKGADVNISENNVFKFKGFVIDEIPDALFQTKEVIYAYVEHCAKAFAGIETARTIESEDFDGLALQGAGKCGEYIPKDNAKAVAKVTVTGA